MQKTAELIEISFGGPRNNVLDGVEISHGKGQFWGLSGPLKSIGSLCYRVRKKRDNSVLHNGTTA